MKGLKLAGVAALALASTASFAQMTPETNPWTVRAGLNLLTDSFTRDVIAKSGFRLGVSYDLPYQAFLAKGGWSSVDLDYSQVNGNGNRLESWTLLYSERMPIGVDLSQFDGPTTGFFYVGAGLGASYHDGRNNMGDDFSSTKFGGQVMAGYFFNKNFFVEASYRLIGTISDGKADGFGLMVGYRF